MDALVVLNVLSSVVDRIEQLTGRKKCGCKWTGTGNYPKKYMKLGLPGGERYWCEKCTDVPPEAVHLDNAVYCTIVCNKPSKYAKDGTRDNRICGGCRNKLPEDEKNKYKDVVHPKCLTCDKQPSYAIVPEGKTYEDVQPVLCKTCVMKLPEDEQNKYENVKAERCEHEGCNKQAMYAEDFTGFPRRYCALHAVPHGFVCVQSKLCKKCKENTVLKNKYPGVCARCDPDSNRCRYETAVLDILKEKYEIVTQFPVYGEGRTKYPFRLDGVMFEDDVIVAIEVDEKSGHNSAANRELDAARMVVCDKYFEKKYSLPVAWIRIVPDISDTSLGKDKDQFGAIASRIRSKIVDRVMEKIDELLKNPASGVFYFRQ